MLNPLVLVFLSAACSAVCYAVAKKRGAKTAYWALMGFLLGPLAIPFVFFSKPKAGA